MTFLGAHRAGFIWGSPPATLGRSTSGQGPGTHRGVGSAPEYLRVGGRRMGGGTAITRKRRAVSVEPDP